MFKIKINQMKILQLSYPETEDNIFSVQFTFLNLLLI